MTKKSEYSPQSLYGDPFGYEKAKSSVENPYGSNIQKIELGTYLAQKKEYERLKAKLGN